MRKLFLTLGALLLFIPSVAWSANTFRYPAVLMDQTCTDDFDTPTRVAPPAVEIGRQPSRRSLTQISGSGDGFCDNDSYIITGAITVDTFIGPFRLARGLANLYFFFDGNTVSGGTTVYQLHVDLVRPHDTSPSKLTGTGNITGTGDNIIVIGPDAASLTVSNETLILITIPNEFYLAIDFQGGGASTISADASLLSGR